jgi:hypothetical protein
VTFKKIKFGKIAIVVFLTFLIWVWADLARDEPLDLPDVIVEVAKSSNPALWVSFVAEREEPALRTSVTLASVVLKGPARKVAAVKLLRNKGTLDLNLFLSPEREGMTKADIHPLDVLDFLKRSDELRQLGLTVIDCEPKRLTLRVQELVKMPVAVECAGLDPSVQVSLQPETVEAYVPKDEGGVRKATVRLTSEEQNRAKNEPVEKTPYVELAPGQRRDIPAKIKVALAPAQNALTSARVPAALGLCFSQNMQGKFRVVLENDQTELAAVMIRATTLAQQAYAQAPYQIILYIQDADRQATELPIQRPVVFNFPDEYVQKGEIEADQKPPTARFTLRPIVETTGTTTESGP